MWIITLRCSVPRNFYFDTWVFPNHSAMIFQDLLCWSKLYQNNSFSHLLIPWCISEVVWWVMQKQRLISSLLLHSCYLISSFANLSIWQKVIMCLEPKRWISAWHLAFSKVTHEVKLLLTFSRLLGKMRS